MVMCLWYFTHDNYRFNKYEILYDNANHSLWFLHKILAELLSIIVIKVKIIYHNKNKFSIIFPFRNVLLGLACNENISDVDLDLSSNQLGSTGAQILESCIHGVRCLSALDISDNGKIFSNFFFFLFANKNFLYRTVYKFLLTLKINRGIKSFSLWRLYTYLQVFIIHTWVTTHRKYCVSVKLLQYISLTVY